MDRPHPNSTYSKLMEEKDEETLDRFSAWRRAILDDAASMERWGRSDCQASDQKDNIGQTRDDRDFS